VEDKLGIHPPGQAEEIRLLASELDQFDEGSGI
jgi:Ni,Fe-hydrogenase III large subunit